MSRGRRRAPGDCAATQRAAVMRRASGRTESRPPRFLSRAILALLVLSTVAASAVSAAGARERSPYTVTTFESPSLGTLLTDGAGFTLYYSTNDILGMSTCSGGCETVWPPLWASTIHLPPSLHRRDFGYITRENGRRQVTYQGWPLYYYSRDWAPHDTNGQGLYGSWYVAQPSLFGPSSK